MTTHGTLSYDPPRFTNLYQKSVSLLVNINHNDFKQIKNDKIT